MTLENRHEKPCRHQCRSQAMTRPAGRRRTSVVDSAGRPDGLHRRRIPARIDPGRHRPNELGDRDRVFSPTYLGGQAARTIARAIIGHRHDRLRRVGIAQLAGGRRLIGLEDALANRSFLLDLGAEAIHVLDEVSNHQATSRLRNTHPRTNAD